MVSLKPSVVIKPTTAPLPSNIVLVATVEPWTNSAHSSRMSETVNPKSAAICSTARITPWLGSEGEDGTFATQVDPSESAKTKSVNVPPTSTPIRHGANGPSLMLMAM
ncbi:MAG TPA: hypothetical protein DCP89_05935 [Acidimicrobiaceae bacterium]|nr:hypothetical protein [Acidimicrobiaceae bacterium]